MGKIFIRPHILHGYYSWQRTCMYVKKQQQSKKEPSWDSTIEQRGVYDSSRMQNEIDDMVIYNSGNYNFYLQ